MGTSPKVCLYVAEKEELKWPPWETAAQAGECITVETFQKEGVGRTRILCLRNINIKAMLPKAPGREVEGHGRTCQREVIQSICSSSDRESGVRKSTEAEVNRQSAVTERTGNQETQ